MGIVVPLSLVLLAWGTPAPAEDLAAEASEFATEDGELLAAAPERSATETATSTPQAPEPFQTLAAAPSAAVVGKPEVRLVAHKTDVAKRYRSYIPPLPFPPFSKWRQWMRDHEDGVHCALEWRTESGEWFHGELRSTHFDVNAELYRVGWGEFPGTAYDAYGIYIVPGRVEREKDHHGKPIEVTLDEELACDYRALEREIRGYAAKNAIPGERGTGGFGRKNVGLGGPAYKPAQNSNTMVKYVLRACGVNRAAPDKAVGWDTEPKFPHCTDVDRPALDTRP